MEIQKTALYNYHKNLGAKFVPFAGYEMPIQYNLFSAFKRIYYRLTFNYFCWKV